MDKPHMHSSPWTTDPRADLLPPVDNGGRYVEFLLAMHGAIVDETDGLHDALYRLAEDTPVTRCRAAWGYDVEGSRGWLQIAPGTSAVERRRATAAFDADMRRRGLVPIAPTMLG